MNIIYFFIVLCLLNVSMFLVIKHSEIFFTKQNRIIRGGVIIILSVIFTIIAGLIYFGMIGWNKEYKEYFEFQVSPERKMCMVESVCQEVDQDGNCVIMNDKNLNSGNFPPKNPCNGNGMNGCQPWTVGWNGNFEMNYNDWLSSNNPVGWKRPDAYSNNMQYVPPQGSCNNNAKPNKIPADPKSEEFNNYSNLNRYWKETEFNSSLLPLPCPQIRENYVKPFNLKCTPQNPCIYLS